ncbi:MAG: prolipoprotein diacylglyceryl transferase [Candidatus Kapabacteria bacterium]|nr:prolipoprotein diacylglyceryl transferase [Candidatus Kapabacteria bacterium]
MEFLNIFEWSISPILLSLGFLQVRWYGLLFALSFILGYQVMLWIFTSEGKSEKDLDSLTFTMILGTVIGARLGHCLFYSPEYYLSHPLDIIKVWEGGLASHGAAFGILIALAFYVRKAKNTSYMWILDRIVIVVALSGFLIRTGNFFNSEIIGKATNVAWAVIFTRVDMTPRHPAQMYEAISCILIFLFLFFQYRTKKANLRPGSSFGPFLTLVFGLRFVWEMFKENQVAFESGMLLNMGQILSIPLVLAGLYFWFIYKGK